MNSSSRSNTSAYLAAVAYAAIIGLSFLFVKLTVAEAHPLDVLAHRFTIGLIAASVPFLTGTVRIRFARRDLWRILLLGLFSPVVYFLCQTYGLKVTTSAEAGIIQAMVPVFTLVLAAFFLKERTSRFQKLSLLLSVGGVVLIILMKSEGSLGMANLQGISLLLLSALSFACYSVIARPLAQKYSPLEITFSSMGIGFAVFMGIALLRHAASGSFADLVQPLSSPQYVLALLYLGVLSSVGTTLLSSFAFSRLEASRVSVFSNLSTIISLAAGALILHEELTVYHLCGSVMIIAGVLGTNRKAKR